MHKLRSIAGLATMIVVSMAVAALAAPGAGRGSGGLGMGGEYQRLYDTATVETVAGEVVAVKHVASKKGMGAGVHLELKTDKETIPVHLGPSWYVDRLKTGIKKGDRLEVKGSRVAVAGKPAIIAAEVKKDDALLKLRDDKGIPAWSGWRRGSAQ